jgi:hypothetical protein
MSEAKETKNLKKTACGWSSGLVNGPLLLPWVPIAATGLGAGPIGWQHPAAGRVKLASLFSMFACIKAIMRGPHSIRFTTVLTARLSSAEGEIGV